VSFDREPGPDDGGLPPVDIVVPDDARALARDLVAYRREMRFRRRREQLAWLSRCLGVRGHAAAFPLIATCAALALLAGMMLSVASVNSGAPLTSATPGPAVTTMPAGSVQLDNARNVSTTTLDGSLLVLMVLADGCGPTARNLARQAKAAGARVYFVYDARSAGASAPQMRQTTTQYGAGVAQTVYDRTGVFFFSFEPQEVTALLVRGDGAVQVFRVLPSGLDLTPALRGLTGTH
jgi:hypothetical protein